MWFISNLNSEQFTSKLTRSICYYGDNILHRVNENFMIKCRCRLFQDAWKSNAWSDKRRKTDFGRLSALGQQACINNEPILAFGSSLEMTLARTKPLMSEKFKLVCERKRLSFFAQMNFYNLSQVYPGWKLLMTLFAQNTLRPRFRKLKPDIKITEIFCWTLMKEII